MKIQPAQRVQKVKEYYFSRKLKEIAQMRQQGNPIINLGIGSPDLPPHPKTIQTLCKQARQEQNHGYQSYTGIPELRQAYALWYEKFFGISLNPENEILPLIGSKEGIMHISMAFLNPGDGVLIPDPGYPTYRAVSELLGAKTQTYDLKAPNNWQPDFQSLEKQNLSHIKIMWTNYPHMPTGTKATPELLQQLVNFGKKHNILICNDNPYSFILNKKPLSIFSAQGAKQVALELNSLSKSHNMAGWRIGMLGGNAQLLSYVLRAKSNMDSGMFRPAQLAAAQALKSPQSWYDKINAEYEKRRKIAEEIFQILNCTFDPAQSGMFLWAKIPENKQNAEEISEDLLKKAFVFITPGFIFGKNGEKYLRISLCSNTQTLAEAKKRIEKNIEPVEKN